ncbi:VOC family protein [Plantactinospora sp. WMMB782]|uniref:VOC family protein n=1 Tax=Plantactinospora sp. WMMB782 TaxID=3404121 RepID=UPI003B93E443
MVVHSATVTTAAFDPHTGTCAFCMPTTRVGHWARRTRTAARPGCCGTSRSECSAASAPAPRSAAYEAVRTTGAEIVHPITDEQWGVRRFFVRDPDGNVVNVVSHR